MKKNYEKLLRRYCWQTKNMQQLRPGIRILSGINHDLAADAQVWSELTGAEDTYNEVDLNIYMIDFCTNWLRGEDFW